MATAAAGCSCCLGLRYAHCRHQVLACKLHQSGREFDSGVEVHTNLCGCVSACCRKGSALQSARLRAEFDCVKSCTSRNANMPSAGSVSMQSGNLLPVAEYRCTRRLRSFERYRLRRVTILVYSFAKNGKKASAALERSAWQLQAVLSSTTLEQNGKMGCKLYYMPTHTRLLSGFGRAVPHKGGLSLENPPSDR